MKNPLFVLIFCAFLMAPVFFQAELFAASSEDSVGSLNALSVEAECPPIPRGMPLFSSELKKPDLLKREPVFHRSFLPSTMDPGIVDLILQVKESQVLGYLEDLVAFGPRVTGSQACKKAGDYIYDTFVSMGLDTRYHPWSSSGYSGNNIEATIHDSSGLNDEIFIVCAHYDSVSGSPGADDNGSGTAATMALAEIMSQYTFDTNIRFVAFSGEEQGLLGSYVYVKEAYNNGDNIVGVLNADMIGFAITQYHMEHIKVYYDTQSQWLLTFTDNVAQQYHQHIELDVVPSGYSWGSDHYYFWDYGYSALFYHEYEFNYYYHSSQDIIANMNIPYHARCTKLLIATLGELAGPFEFLPLRSDAYTLSVREGGMINFFLDAEVDNAGRDYILLGSGTGTEPGITLPGGLATLPLVWDMVTDMIWAHINTPSFSDFMGTLDSNGEATAQLNTFGPISPAFVGIELVFSFALNDPWDFASNPITIEVVD